MTRYIRLVDAADTLGSARRIFDLCDGSLDESHPRGTLHGFEVWSAEALLTALDSLVRPGKLIYVTGYDSDEEPEPMPEVKEHESEMQRKLRLLRENSGYGSFINYRFQCDDCPYNSGVHGEEVICDFDHDPRDCPVKRRHED